MILGPINLILFILMLISFFLIFWSIVVFMGENKSFSFSDKLLGAFVSSFLIIILEVYFVSQIPIVKPLSYLWLPHIILVCFLIFFQFRNKTIIKWKESFFQAKKSIIYLWKSINNITKIFPGIILLVLISYFIFAIFSNPNGGSDVLSYHISMAVQPYQDGVLGKIDSDLPWVYLYPKGAETIWYWTLQLTNSDIMFNGVQFLFGLQLLFALYVLSKRSGISQKWAIYAVGIFATMPLFFILTTTGYIDICYASSVIAMVAFLAPFKKENICRDFLLICMALSLSSMIKIPVVAFLYFGVFMFFKFIYTKNKFKDSLKNILEFLNSKIVLLSIVVLLIANLQYIKNWILFNNPIYPLGLKIINIDLFHGIINSSDFGLGGSSTMGSLYNMNYLQRIFFSMSDISNPLTVDSFGSAGLVFIGLVLLVSLLSVIFIFIKKKNTWLKIIASVYIFSFFIPGFFLPRYAVPMYALAIVLCVYLLSFSKNFLEKILQYLIILMCIISLFVSFKYVISTLNWIYSQSNGSLSWRLRSSLILEKQEAGGSDSYPHPEVIKFIRDNSGKDDILVWNINTFQGLLWNRNYSNNIIFLPGTKNDRWPGGPSSLSKLSTEEQDIWINNIKNINPKDILVYKNSIYPNLVLEKLKGKYKIALESKNIANDMYSVIILERQ